MNELNRTKFAKKTYTYADGKPEGVTPVPRAEPERGRES